MLIKKVNSFTIDVFLDFDTHPTGFEESCWLRLVKTPQHQNKWKQVGGIRLPSYKYQAILKTLK